MKRYLVCICFVCFGLTMYGQSDHYLDKVVLTNGTAIWGIVEIEEDQVKIFLGAEDSLTVPKELVKTLKTGKLNPVLYLDRAKGVYYQGAVGVLLGKGHRSSENEASFSASFVSGYKFKPSLGVGLGMGLNYYPEQRHIPLFVNVQGDLLRTRVTPFYQVNAGWSWGYERKTESPIDRLEGGFYLSPAIGLKWHFARHSWLLQFSYVRQNSTTYFESLDFGNGNVATNVEDRTFQRVGISLGLSF